jgi:glutamine synthetase
MYLFVAAILSAGMAGIKQKLPLNIRDCPLLPSDYTTKEAEERLSKYGITEAMPSKLELALDSAKCDEDLVNWIGAELLAHYCKVKDKEVEYFSKMSEEERRQKFLGYF